MELPSENPDMEKAGKMVKATEINTFNEIERHIGYDRLKKLGRSLYYATLPFVFGIIVNLTGDYLTASVVTVSAFIGPYSYKNYW